MSLVHEALRKAEREKQRKVGSVQQASPPATPQPHYEPPAVSAPVGGATRDAVAHKSAAADEPAPAPREPNHYLLPALIGCVAIVAIIAIVFIVSSASSVLRQSKDIPATVAAQATPAPLVTAAIPPEPQPPAQPAAQTPADSAAPPSAPPPSPPAADGSKFTLTGIMQEADGKYSAVINGHVTYEGSSVGGATVKSIEHDHAVLIIDGHETALRLF